MPHNRKVISYLEENTRADKSQSHTIEVKVLSRLIDYVNGVLEIHEDKNNIQKIFLNKLKI